MAVADDEARRRGWLEGRRLGGGGGVQGKLETRGGSG